MIDHPPKICQACVHSAVTGNWGWLADEEHWPFFTQAVRDMLEYAHLDEAEWVGWDCDSCGIRQAHTVGFEIIHNEQETE